jgi:hypothetical protein
MTEQERIDRERLLKRAAAAAGAAYLTPVLTSSAAADVDRRCALRKCTPGPDGDIRCQGKRCMCCDSRGRCSRKPSKCCKPDPRCPPSTPCDVAFFCNSSATCLCLGPIPGDRSQRDCVDFPSNFCADYPPCNRADGSGCPPGMCCLDVCCPDAICSTPCGVAPDRGVNWTAGSGPTLTLT